MVTRTFCDHCGLKTPVVTKFYFGRYAPPAEIQYVQAGPYGGGGGLLGGQQNAAYGVGAYLSPPVQSVQTSKPTERYYPTVIVDLCEVCVPIWYERACNLTKATKD
jgi:hypothetical protein